MANLYKLSATDVARQAVAHLEAAARDLRTLGAMSDWDSPLADRLSVRVENLTDDVRQLPALRDK